MNLRIWDSENGSLLRTLCGHTHAISSIVVANVEADPIIVSGSGDSTVRVWNFSNGKLLRVLVGHTLKVNSVCVVQLGDLNNGGIPVTVAVSGSEDCSIRMWDVVTGECSSILDAGDEVTAVSARCSPGGKEKGVGVLRPRLLVAAGTMFHRIKIWEVTDHCQQIHCLRGHQQAVTAVQFAQEDDTSALLLLSSAADWTVRVWDVQSGSSVRVIRRHNSSVVSMLSFHRFRRLVIMSSSSDGNCLLWCLRSGETVSSTRWKQQTSLRCVDVTSAGPGTWGDGSLLVAFGGRGGRLEIRRLDCSFLSQEEGEEGVAGNVSAGTAAGSLDRNGSPQHSRMSPRAIPLPVLTARSMALGLEPRPPSPYIPTPPPLDCGKVLSRVSGGGSSRTLFLDDDTVTSRKTKNRSKAKSFPYNRSASAAAVIPVKTLSASPSSPIRRKQLSVPTDLLAASKSSPLLPLRKPNTALRRRVRRQPAVTTTQKDSLSLSLTVEQLLLLAGVSLDNQPRSQQPPGASPSSPWRAISPQRGMSPGLSPQHRRQSPSQRFALRGRESLHPVERSRSKQCSKGGHHESCGSSRSNSLSRSRSQSRSPSPILHSLSSSTSLLLTTTSEPPTTSELPALD